MRVVKFSNGAVTGTFVVMFNDLMHGPPAKIDFKNDNVVGKLEKWYEHIIDNDYKNIDGERYSLADIFDAETIPKKAGWKKIFNSPMNGAHISGVSSYEDEVVDYMLVDRNFNHNVSENYLIDIVPKGKIGTYYYIRGKTYPYSGNSNETIINLKFKSGDVYNTFINNIGL